jgi:hypothetical protein
MQYTKSILAIKQVCNLLADGQVTEAGLSIKNNYSFQPVSKPPRQYTPRQITAVFIRDGFIDRYKGYQLVFPPSMRLISHYLPKEFPYHKNGKMDEGHIAYWELFPTIDHLYPIARGGKDEESNWICCSMLTNSIKSNWTLDELEWKLLPPGDFNKWDGMLGWFIHQIETDKSFLANKYFKDWYYAVKSINA